MSTASEFYPITVHDAAGGAPRLRRHPDEVEEFTFKDLGLTEADVEEFVRRNIEVLFPTEDESLLVVGQQPRNQQGGIADLVAIDGSGNVVLIELKRDEGDMKVRREKFEFQAIRYAANYALITRPAEIVERLFAPYVERHSAEFDLPGLTASERATRRLDAFLSETGAANTFNAYQRIVLVASSFDDQTLSACAWLCKSGVDIRCVALAPVRHDGRLFLLVDQVVPPPKLNDYFVEIATPGAPATVRARSAGTKSRTSLPRLSALIEAGLVAAGDTVHVHNHPGAVARIVDGKYVELGGQNVRINDWGADVTGWSAINVYAWVVHEPTGKTLDALRREMMDAQAATDSAADPSEPPEDATAEPAVSVPALQN